MNEQYIFELDQLPIKDILLQAQTTLLAEFLSQNPEFNSGAELTRLLAFSNPNGNNKVLYSDNKVWKMAAAKAYGDVIEKNRAAYPTAFSLVDKFGDDCDIAVYSVLEPKSTIYRHTDEENRQALKIRIHIPLIIPEGDIGIEVDGNIRTWDNIFAFNTQKLHGAWNNTNCRRLVFILDINRKRLGLPAGIPWTPGTNINATRFERTEPPR
jgi:hypothetical protein